MKSGNGESDTDCVDIKPLAKSTCARDSSIGQLLDVEYQQVVADHSHWYAERGDETKYPKETTAEADAEGISTLQAALDLTGAATR
ncbi:hypothetical protein [Zymobacter palmae]|uniref:Uncharacterizedlow-complexity proteins n=1 Tax=Zymobacter palmae TaxID=33074 RepID=A0A348HEK3_9GAMM|nr:hypothetical protein [Zymobacter palmae]BBG30055.1 uncharacterizedlow-complexity proteins [Zymobacter palmae]